MLLESICGFTCELVERPDTVLEHVEILLEGLDQRVCHLRNSGVGADLSDFPSLLIRLRAQICGVILILRHPVLAAGNGPEPLAHLCRDSCRSPILR